MKTSFNKNQIRLGSIAGIPLTFDYSWFLVLFLLTWLLSVSYFPSEYKNWDKSYYWISGAITSILFFLSVILHEVGHSLMAKKFDYKVKKVKMFIFGGISEITEEPKQAKEEFLIAAAGPAVTFLLALLFYIIEYFTKNVIIIYAIAHYLFIVNLILGIFNILPGFPLDGGRILRAIIWKRNNNFEKATQITAGIGRIFGFIVITIGFLIAMSGDFFDGIWLSFIGWFLESAAFSQTQKQVLTKYLQGHTVEEAMTKSFGLVPADTTISEFIQNDILIRHRRAFIVEDNSKNIGLLTIHDIKKIPQEKWGKTNVTAVMKPLNEVKIVDVNHPLEEALKEMDKDGVNQMPVMEDGKIVGMLNRESILSFIANINLLSN